MLTRPLTSLPRESLFDALNVPTGGGITIKNEYTGFGGDVIVLVDDNIVATLANNDAYDVSTGEFSLIGDIPDYMPQYRAYDTDGTLIASGDLDGTSLETTTPIAEIIVYNWLYSDTSTETAFDVGYIPKGGIFAALAGLTGKAYFTDSMDADYLTTHSGTKAVSNAVWAYLVKYGEDVEGAPVRVLSSAGIIALAKLIWQRYGDAWEHIYNALIAEYEPLENYKMHEETSPDLTDTYGVSDDYEKRRHTETNADVDTETSVYGFNSSSPVPSGKSNTSGNALNNNAEDVETQKGTRTEKKTGKTTVDRSGNIGVTTSQQMLESEIQVRIKNHMDDIIYNDCDQVLTTAGFAPILSPTINII